MEETLLSSMILTVINKEQGCTGSSATRWLCMNCETATSIAAVCILLAVEKDETEQVLLLDVFFWRGFTWWSATPGLNWWDRMVMYNWDNQQ